MKELIRLTILIAYCSISDAVYYGQKRCTFDEGICKGWRLMGNTMIVNTTTHNFTVSGNFTQNDSFIYLPASSFETTFLALPTYYRLCQISLAVTLNMTSLEVLPQSNLPFHFYAATQDHPLLPWTLVNISIPSYTRSLTAVFRSYKLWFNGAIAGEFDIVGEGDAELPSNGPADFYIGLDDVTLTYCLPCNFDDLPGNLMLTILPAAVNVIQLVPLANINITLQVFSSICDGQRFIFQILNMSAELEQYSTSIRVVIQQLTNDSATLNVMFSSHDAFTGGAHNFTITVGAGIMYSNYLGYGTPPMVQRTVTLMQPGLISTRVPPDPIYYIPEQTISYQIEAHSVLAPNNMLKYEFAGADPLALDGLLVLDIRSGLIAGVIMTEEQAHLSAQSYVNVTIHDLANNKLIKITIPVMLGQLAPTFLDAVNDVIIVPVREDTRPYSVIDTLRVMDLNNDTVSISLGQFISGPHIFSLNLSDGHQLILDSQLDYETPTNYSFTIEAAEMLATRNANPLTSTATVNIQVLPVNEYPPVIMPTTWPIQLVVPETVVGSIVAQVIATDQDSGSDGTLNYRITHVAHNNVQIPPQIFTINSTTGDIIITQLLEEGLYNYTITVLVADMGTPPMTATVDLTVDVIGHQKNISCDFSVGSCDWLTDFYVRNPQAVSPIADYNTNSLNTGGYIFLTSSQITGGSKIFLTLDDVTTSVINEIVFVYQLNGSVSILLQASSRTIWSSVDSPGVATGVGDWRRVRLYAGSVFVTSNHLAPTHLQFVAMGSLEGFAAVDDLTVQVKSRCDYDSLSNPDIFNFDLPSITTIPFNDPKIIPSSLTLTECRNEPVVYAVTVLPDHLMPYFSYNNGAINVLGLNSIIASNGTTGTVMVSATITAVDLFEGNKHFTYNDTVNFVVISFQQCVVTKQCSFNVDSCDWQIFNPVILTNASAVGVSSRSSGQLISGDYFSMQNLTLAMSTTINGSYCRVSFYYYATSGIVLSVHNPSSSGELWISSLLPQQPDHWNLINVHISYSLDPREKFDLSFRVSGVGLLLLDDVTLHPCIDCETGCRNIMCPAGEFYTIFDGCQPCLTGHYCLGGTSSAIPCVAGTFNDAERSTSNSSCKSCPFGSYSTSGSTDCSFNTSLTCALGSYPNISEGVATCVLCQPGSACPTGSILWPCPEGFTASMPGAVNCTMCPAGYKCPNVSSDPIKCEDKQYSLDGEMECHDCPKGFSCNGSAPIPHDQTQTTMKVDLSLECSEDHDHSSNSRIFIIIIIIIIVVALLVITLMTCYIIRLRYQIVKYQEHLACNDVQYAARDGNIAINSTYQPYKRNSRLSKDGLDLSNFSTCDDDDDGDVMENEGFRDEEIEMTEKNTMSLLISTDGSSQL